MHSIILTAASSPLLDTIAWFGWADGHIDYVPQLVVFKVKHHLGLP